jgi:hypothetical protein
MLFDRRQLDRDALGVVAGQCIRVLDMAGILVKEEGGTVTFTRIPGRADGTGQGDTTGCSLTDRSHLEVLVVGLTMLIGVVAGAAAVVGVSARPQPVTVSTVRAGAVELFGAGVYQYDTVFAGAGNRGTDAVTLLVALPLLVVAVLGYRRGSLRWQLMLTGVLVWFLYVYATMAVGTAFNPLFALYVAVFSASLLAFVIVVTTIDVAALAGQLPRLPRRAPAVLMLISAVATTLIWWVPVLAAQLTGTVPARLDTYTTLVTTAIDAAVITPAAVAAGVLILRRQVWGYLLAMPLLILEAMLAPTIAAQTISQLNAGIALAPGEIAGPLAGFLVIAIVAIAVLVGTLRAVQQPMKEAGEMTPESPTHR